MTIHPGNLASDINWPAPSAIFVYPDGTWGLERRSGAARFELKSLQTRKTIETLPIETLRALLHINPETGDLTWQRRPDELFPTAFAAKAWNARFCGLPALEGNLGKGYRGGEIFGQRYKKHRVVWALIHGEWPDGEIDHIDHNPGNNAPRNLRVVDRSVNLKNRPAQRNNRSGIVGVHWSSPNRKWFVSIGVNGRDIYLGLYGCIGCAIRARKAAETTYGFHANHGKHR